MRKQFAVLAVLLSWCVVAFAETPAEFDARIEKELAAQDAQAVSMWKQANAAREADRHADAVALYEKVYGRVPTFVHALRRQAAEELRADRKDLALAHGRQAVEQERSDENLTTLAMIMLATKTDASEAAKLAREATVLDPEDSYAWFMLAQAGQELGDLDMIREATVRLESLAPKDLQTHMLRAVLAVNDGDYDEANAAVVRAKSFGLPQQDYESALQWVQSTKPFYVRWWKPAVFGLLGWFAGFGVMLLAGAILSRMALRAAERTDDLSLTVRRLYRIVLGICCAFYYASIPIVIAFVLALSGGIIYATFVLGHIPVKLVILAVCVAGVSVWSMLKSLFIRAKDEDPGLRLELEHEPKLRALLDSVAAKIGTHAVDNVYLTPSTDVAVMERKRGKERCLILGVAALDGLAVRPFKSILGHEYGHFSNRDTAGGAFALSVRRSLMATAIGLAQGGVATWYNPAWLFVNAFHRLFLRISEGASRLQEVLADRWAVFAYGADAFEAGLRHVVTRGVQFDAHVECTLKEVVNGQIPLSNLYTYAPAKAADDVSSAIEEALNRKSTMYDSHPAPAERFALIHKLPAQSIAPELDDDAPASSLFTNFEALQLRMTAQVRENVKANTGLEIAAPAAV
ncbi:MAG TPA: M48 family metalloprotease [Thermoanaerobaculia bacterium]|nr:M48 family metalloprotease [Thermoanaerobaculia bacterium]